MTDYSANTANPRAVGRTSVKPVSYRRRRTMTDITIDPSSSDSSDPKLPAEPSGASAHSPPTSDATASSTARGNEIADHARHSRSIALALTLTSAILFAVGIFAPSFTMIPKLGNGYFEWLVRRFVSSDLEPRSFSLVGGIFHLFHDRELFIGSIILLFSVVFPAAKLAALGLSFRLERGSVERHLGLLEQLGKWSMLDVFVIAALVVCFKGFPGGSHVEVQWGIYVFAASVVLSMLATRAMRRYHSNDSHSASP
jgi:Paraquat-inducible protein A